MPNSRLRGMFRLFRLELPFAAGICVVLGEMLALGALPAARDMILGFLSVFCISASALILNDYFDLEIDRINAPERPLPSGQVTRRDVVLLSTGVTLPGFAAGFLIGGSALVVVVFVWVVGFLYNWKFKRAGVLGNLMVCTSVGMTFILGGITVNKPFESIVWFFGLWVMLVDLGEEIAADAMDMEGDKALGSRSLAVLYGREQALRISAAIFLLVVAASAVPFLLGWLSWMHFLPIALTDGIIVYSTVKLLDPEIDDRRKYIRWIYRSGSLALVLLILLRVAMR
ncbi:MAG: UbiA family prenyltransferase [Ignavibacteria bacterium]|nr:UbiA family prenyltransferase [Ignavibacteria bacterium]